MCCEDLFVESWGWGQMGQRGTQTAGRSQLLHRSAQVQQMTVQHNLVWVMRCGNSSSGPRWRDSSPEWLSSAQRPSALHLCGSESLHTLRFPHCRHSTAQLQTACRPRASLRPPSSAHLQPEHGSSCAGSHHTCPTLQCCTQPCFPGPTQKESTEPVVPAEPSSASPVPALGPPGSWGSPTSLLHDGQTRGSSRVGRAAGLGARSSSQGGRRGAGSEPVLHEPLLQSSARRAQPARRSRSNRRRRGSPLPPAAPGTPTRAAVGMRAHRRRLLSASQRSAAPHRSHPGARRSPGPQDFPGSAQSALAGCLPEPAVTGAPLLLHAIKQQFLPKPPR